MITLFPWQEPSANRLVEILSRGNFAANLSMTGLGKGYSGIEVARRLGLRPLIIAPKSALTMWERLCVTAEIVPLAVKNVEQLKRGNTEFVTPVNKKFFKWNMPKDGLVIWDEIHMAGGIDTANSVLLAQTKSSSIKVLGLSATISSSGPLSLRAAGYLMGLHKYTASDYFRWCLQRGAYRNPWSGVSFASGPSRIKHLECLNQEIAPYCVRLTVEDAPGFPDNLLIPDLVNCTEEQTQEVNKMYADMPEEVKQGAKPGSTALVKLLRARQKTEYLKVPLLAESVEGLIEEGRSVVCFLNFREPLDLLQKDLEKRGIRSLRITGSETQEERQRAMDEFNTDKLFCICCQISAGGQSVSLHHTDPSTRPRSSLICPPLSAREFVQALGRIHRAGGISKAIQKVFLMAGTVEENVYQSLERKKENISLLSDFDMMGVKDDEETIGKAPQR